MSKRIEELDTNFKDQGSKIEEGLAWISAKDPRFTVNGLAWFEENGREFLRLPKRAKGVVPDGVWELATMPTNACVRFKTDSTTLKLRIQHSRPEVATARWCAVGASGIDLYLGPPARRVYWGSNNQIVSPQRYVSSYFEKLPRKLREITLYLPTYNDLVLLEIGLDPRARLAPPSRFRLAKPVLFYGTSVTQGSSTSRGATGYVPVVGRRLGIDVINLGFSGSGNSEASVADLVAEVDLACLVNDCVANMREEGMEERYLAFNEKIRARWPRLPILLMTCFPLAPCIRTEIPAARLRRRNRLPFLAYRQFRARGDRNVHLLDCRDLKGFAPDHPSVDGVHLNDLGFLHLADAVTPRLKRILKLT
jgi:hypothetical protein